MSRLNFACIDEAYSIGSEQIKKTQDEIAKLKKIVEDSANIGNRQVQNIQNIQNIPNSQNLYKRIGNPDMVSAEFCNGQNNPNQNGNRDNSDNDLDFTFFKLMKHPKFEDIIKNYILFKHPEWLGKGLSGTQYSPGNNSTNTKEYFGQKYSNTICTDIKNYVIFFILSIIMYLLLVLFLKK